MALETFKYFQQTGFISYTDCDKLIDYFKDKLKSSEVIGDSSLRNSDDFFINHNEITDQSVKNIILELKKKFSDISGLPIRNQELLTIIRYKPGQRFETHYDFFSDNELELEELVGGQRLFTSIVCLREAVSGGFTRFDNLGVDIKLNTGECIYWNNLDLDGKVFTDSLHSGTSPNEGEKWILSCWIRKDKHIPVGHHFLQKLSKTFSKEQIKEVLKTIDYE